MKFSIVVPVFNTAPYLPACIESVLAQEEADWELVLVDDGSDDGSLAVCHQYAARDSRIRVLGQPNRGVSSARNRGLGEAMGEWVSIVDSDDTIAPDTLIQAQSLVTEPRVDLVIFSMCHRSENAGGMDERRIVLRDRLYPGVTDWLAGWVREGSALLYSTGNKFYRKATLDRCGVRFDESIDFGEDRLFNFSYLEHCGAVATSSAVTYTYFLRPTVSLSSRFRIDFIDRVLGLHAAKRRMLAEHGFTESRCREFLAEDLHREIYEAVKHLQGHWKKLGVEMRWKAVRRLITARYPRYLDDIRDVGPKQSAMLTTVRLRSAVALYGLLWFAGLRASG